MMRAATPVSILGLFLPFEVQLPGQPGIITSVSNTADGLRQAESNVGKALVRFEGDRLRIALQSAGA